MRRLRSSQLWLLGWWLATGALLVVAAGVFAKSDSYPVLPPPVCGQGSTANDLAIVGLVILGAVAVSAAVGAWRVAGWRWMFAPLLIGIPVVFLFWLGAALAVTQPLACLHR
jgi:hypothetical protein